MHLKHATLFLFSLLMLACGGNESESAINEREGLGPLTDVVFAGKVDGWNGDTRDGVYWLQNEAGDPNDLRYFYTHSSGKDKGQRSARIDVFTSEMHPEGNAGILYGYREQPKFYYLITATKRGSVDVFKREGNNFDLIQSNSINTAEVVRLEVREHANKLSVLANDQILTELENENVSKGLIGIAAFGPGKFGFSNYKESTATDNAALVQEPQTNLAHKSSIVEKPNNELTMLEFIDPKNGMVQHRSPFPKGWRYDNNPNDQLLLIGPNGTEVYQSDSGRFVYSNDPFALQSARQMGAQTAPPMPVDEFLKQQFTPYMAQKGFKLFNQFPLPKIKDIWEIFAAGMPQGLSRKQFEVIGAEWEHQDGTQALTILVLNIMQNQQFLTWSVSANELYSAKANYKQSKDSYIYAATNLDINPQWQIFMNNQLLSKIKADKDYFRDQSKLSQAQHIGRMNAILSRGNTSSNTAKINSDILDISHAGFLNRSDLVSSGQLKSINTIAEKSVISNPGTGELYRVDAGAKNYWVNSDGKYLSTDNVLYDPRTDLSISDQQWERFNIVQ